MNHSQGRPRVPRPGDGPETPWPPAARLVGRDAQQQELLSVLVGLEEVAAAGALLVGETGMGKTSLLRAVCAGVQGVVLARARPGDRLVPYSALARWLRALGEEAGGPLDDASGLQLSPREPEQISNAAGGYPAPPLPAAVAQSLLRASDKIVAWALDDLHLADDASLHWWHLFLKLQSPTATPFILASAPPSPGSDVEKLLETAAGMDRVRTLQIGPLRRNEVFDWVMDDGAPALSAARADAITTRLMQVTAGVPLHLHLLLHDPRRSAGSLSEASGQAGEVSPQPLTMLLGERLARLSSAALAVARVAAVAEQDYSDDAAMDFTGLTPAELAAALQELREQELWTGEDFAHASMRDAARQATPHALAQAVHGHIAAWLEASSGAQERVAAHWQAAGLPARAVPALRHAARRARQLHCMADAIARLARAATIAEEHGQLDLAFDCCCEAFETHADALRDTDGEALLAQLKRLARTPRQRARATAQAAWHAMVTDDLDSALRTGSEAVRLAEAEGDEQLIAPARQVLGTALGVAGHLGRALQLLQAAQGWIEQRATADERASFHGNLAAVLDNLGRSADARDHHQSALSQVPREWGVPQRATLLANYALSRLEAGDPIGARELGAKAQALVDVAEANPDASGLVALVMAQAERSLGRYTTALAWCDRAEHVLAERVPDRMALAHLQRAHVWLDIGWHERAAELLGGPGLPLGRELPARHAVRWLWLLGRAQVLLGTDAEATLREAEGRLPAEGWPELQALLSMERALALADARGAQRLHDVAEQAADAGLDNVALGAWLQCALLAASLSDELALARTAADAALALLVRGVESTHVDRALRWLAPARALAACGETQRARGLILRGQQSLASTAAHHVPPPARHGFLHTHPLNRLLLEADTARV